jgi:hypothetical protein
MNELEKVVEKYFRDENIRYYNPSDAMANNHFIRWTYFRGERNKILLTIGSDEGEVDVRIFTNPEDLEKIINLIIF